MGEGPTDAETARTIAISASSRTAADPAAMAHCTVLYPGEFWQQWYVDPAMDKLLETGFEVAEKERLYRCLDRVLEHKQDSKSRWNRIPRPVAANESFRQIRVGRRSLDETVVGPPSMDGPAPAKAREIGT
jgi:hypothetical protein